MEPLTKPWFLNSAAMLTGLPYRAASQSLRRRGYPQPSSPDEPPLDKKQDPRRAHLDPALARSRRDCVEARTR